METDVRMAAKLGESFRKLHRRVQQTEAALLHTVKMSCSERGSFLKVLAEIIAIYERRIDYLERTQSLYADRLRQMREELNKAKGGA